MVDDTMMSCVYTFPCDRWLAKDEDDGRITRELLAGKGDAGIPYTVQVFTGMFVLFLFAYLLLILVYFMACFWELYGVLLNVQSHVLSSGFLFGFVSN